ncbi:MAG TPA: hypothetical protein EYP17_04055 [Candidatus Latescibacteria bacterium]|nr:hypothetical protein [Candidatus Latescibacterota bacterium]
MFRTVIKVLLVFRLERWTPFVPWDAIWHYLRRPVAVQVALRRKDIGLPFGLYPLNDYDGPVIEGPSQN